jgi:UDP-N-acetylglucosamine 2-epimerase (non-hydrolysing)
MKVKKLLLVAGARPNFMKIAPVLRAVAGYPENIQALLVHTGQHYDQNMSKTFFNSLGIKEPDYNLEVGSGSHAVQTANIMIRFEELCVKENPDLVVVVGDVNSTIATGLVAKKLHIDLAHIEAGLRSRDRNMPEEINRLATDAITDLFFTTEKQGTNNLISEGHPTEKIHFVGHVMIDNLFFQLGRLKDDNAVSEIAKKIKSSFRKKYACMTMHRPSNVDDPLILNKLLEAIHELSKNIPIIFACHPRTRKNVEDFAFGSFFTVFSEQETNKHKSGIIMTDPLDYNDFLYLWKDAQFVLTDSGGLQEETTALQIPCLTMRTSTERPITVEVGSNEIAGIDGDRIKGLGEKVLNGTWKKSSIPDLWDGKASERIVDIIAQRR